MDNRNNQQIHITKRKYKKNLEEDIQKKNIQKKTNRNRKSPVLVKDIQENPRLSQEDWEQFIINGTKIFKKKNH